MTATFTDTSNLSWTWPKLDSGPILPKNWTLDDLSRRRVDWGDTDVVWPYRGTMGFGWIQQTLCPFIPNGEIGWDPRGMSGRSWAANCTGVMMPHWFGCFNRRKLCKPPVAPLAIQSPHVANRHDAGCCRAGADRVAQAIAVPHNCQTPDYLLSTVPAEAAGQTTIDFRH
jgi:hypothetical protein